MDNSTKQNNVMIVAAVIAAALILFFMAKYNEAATAEAAHPATPTAFTPVAWPTLTSEPAAGIPGVWAQDVIDALKNTDMDCEDYALFGELYYGACGSGLAGGLQRLDFQGRSAGILDSIRVTYAPNTDLDSAAIFLSAVAGLKYTGADRENAIRWVEKMVKSGKSGSTYFGGVRFKVYYEQTSARLVMGADYKP